VEEPDWSGAGALPEQADGFFFFLQYLFWQTQFHTAKAVYDDP
jgi:hypothetical protein